MKESESEPKTQSEVRSNIKPEKIEDYSDIPLYEKLNEESQKFVVEVKELSEMSEEEFLNKNPNIRELVDRSVRHHDGKKRIGIAREMLRSLLNDIGLGTLPPEDLTDQIRDIGTMWDFVRLHLLELKDFIDTGQTDHHGRQTEYLTEKIIDKIITNFKGPDSIKGLLGDIKEKEMLTDDTNKRLIIINRVLSEMHECPDNNEIPSALYFIRDLWRYAILKRKTIRGKNVADIWGWQYKNFFSKLSNLRLKEN